MLHSGFRDLGHLGWSFCRHDHHLPIAPTRQMRHKGALSSGPGVMYLSDRKPTCPLATGTGTHAPPLASGSPRVNEWVNGGYIPRRRTHRKRENWARGAWLIADRVMVYMCVAGR